MLTAAADSSLFVKGSGQQLNSCVPPFELGCTCGDLCCTLEGRLWKLLAQSRIVWAAVSETHAAAVMLNFTDLPPE